MLDNLLDYYERELFFLRRMGSVFSRKYPKIAQRLMLEPDKCDDPHVERILEGVAFLAARVHSKLDEEFPEVSASFIDSLLPHFLLPIPSLSIAQMHTKPGQWLDMPAGTLLHTRLIRPHDTRCRFRTCLPVQSWPVVVHDVAFVSTGVLRLPADIEASWAMRLILRSQEASFRELMPPQERSSLRFYLDGPRQFALYEALVRPSLSQRRPHIFLRLSDGSLRPLRLRPVGFAPDEGVLPYSGRSFLGYRLLQEYFAFPKKFLFLEIADLDAELRRQLGPLAEILILGSGATPNLTPQIDDFKLGCTPIINLFPQPAEPISLTHMQSEYRVVGNARQEATTEVYSVDEVISSSVANAETVHYQPLYGLKDRIPSSDGRFGAYYKCSRRIGEHGSDVFVSLVDLGLNLHQPARDTLLIKTTCTNRDLAGRLPLGISRRARVAPKPSEAGTAASPLKGGPCDEYDLTHEGDFIPPASWADKLAHVDCLERPSPSRRLPMGKSTLWQLVSHLNLNHLSLMADEHGLAAFKEMLHLYDVTSSAGDSNAKQIAGLLELSSERTVGRARDGLPGFCRGVAVRLRLHSEHFVGASPFLFASVMDCFFAQYVSINSFTTLRAENEHGQELGTWAPRLGARPVL